MQRHTMTEIVKHSTRFALERSVKYYRFYVATILALSSAVVYTWHLFSPLGGFQTHEINISENIKIERIQRCNNDEDSTARNNWNAEAKENQQLDSGGPDQNKPSYRSIFGSIVYSRAKVYIHQNFLKVIVHVIIIDQWNQAARMYEIHGNGYVFPRYSCHCDVRVSCKEDYL